MSNKKNTEMVSLCELCDEAKMVTEENTGKTIKKPVYFSSMKALIHGAFALVEWFEQLHQKGKVYHSNLADVFWFSLKTGKLLYQEPRKNAIEISEFLAPELVEELKKGENQELPFSIETDRYFLSVFLFEYFFHTGSPFEGKKMVNRCFLSPLEKEVFRVEQGQFCMEPGEHENIPVKGIQDKLIFYWKEYPDLLKKMFQKAFLEGGNLYELRPTEIDWKQTLVRMAMDYQVCGCGFQGFSDKLYRKENGTLLCPKCGKTFYVLSNGMDRILLSEGARLYECQTGTRVFDKDTITAVVVENRQKRGLYGIKNISKGVWKGLFPDGTTREIGEGQGIPIWNGMMVRFETGEEWTLRLLSHREEKEADENEQ